MSTILNQRLAIVAYHTETKEKQVVIGVQVDIPGNTELVKEVCITVNKLDLPYIKLTDDQLKLIAEKDDAIRSKINIASTFMDFKADKLYLRNIYKHFKGKLYYTLNTVYNLSEDRFYVLYAALYDDNEVYLRPLDMFLSEVDKEKYPTAKQEYRFMPLSPIGVNNYFVDSIYNNNPLYKVIEIPESGLRADLFYEKVRENGLDFDGDVFLPYKNGLPCGYRRIEYIDKDHIVKVNGSILEYEKVGVMGQDEHTEL